MITKSPTLPQKIADEKGFTLIELMIVVIIIAIVAGLTLGEINSASYQLKSRAHTLKAHMMRAKLESVKRDLNVTVTISENEDGYNITDSTGASINTVNYPNKFTFTGNNTTFTSRGTANSSYITVVGNGTTNPEYKISINTIGRVRLEKTKN